MGRDVTEACEDVEKLIPVHVKEIRSQLEAEHNVVIPEHCEEFIVRCLRTKDGNVERAVKLIRAYQVAIENFKQWNVELLPSSGADIQRNAIVVPMKKRDADGRYVIILRLGMWDPEKTSFEQGIALVWMITQYMSTEMKDVPTKGFVTVFDFTGFSLKHAWAVHHWKFISLCKWGHNGVAGRLKALHVVNHPKIAHIMYKALMPLLKEKQKNRIIMHGSIDSLLIHVGAEYLPTFLGGTQDPEECIDKANVERFFNSDQYFREMLETGFPSK